MNVLLMPWPDEIMPAQFTPVGRNYFSFRLREDPVKISRYCADVVKEAKRMFGEVHAVIFPECSLGRTEHKLVRDAILGETALLIAGISDSFGSGEDLGVNSVNVDVSITPNTYVSLNQPKHHRWRLDDDQIAQYNLGSRLLPSHSWYEGITLQDRRISFLALRRWMVLSVLICEDLARQDPVGTILRNVGPHLVVALLMDGPQISPRWPGRYAMGLADDPGSAVLTLTSRGMMKLSRPVRGVPRRESIALWKGATGPVHEIDAPEGAAGVVLSLTAKEVMERSLDSRDCPGYALELSGVREVRVPHGDQ